MTMRRPTTWDDRFLFETVVQDVGQVLVDLTPGFDEADKRGATVIRMLLQLHFYEAALNTAKGANRLTFGVGLATTEAFAIGGTAIPSVEIAADKPRLGWYMRGDVLVPFSGSDATRPVPLVDYRADIRTMRKFERGILYMAFRNTTELGPGSSLSVRGLVRTLIKL